MESNESSNTNYQPRTSSLSLRVKSHFGRHWKTYLEVVVGLAVVIGGIAALWNPIIYWWESRHPPIVSVEIRPPRVELFVDQSTVLVAIPRDANGNPQVDKETTWFSTSPQVVSVAVEEGQITGVSTGTANIVVTTEGQTGTATITVKPAPVARIELSPEGASVQVGEETTFVVRVLNAAGRPVTGRQIEWATSQPRIATVTSPAVVKGLAAGTTVVSATCEGQTAVATITVEEVPIASFKITPRSVAVFEGESAELEAVVRDASGNRVFGCEVSWSSSNNQIAVVYHNGVVWGTSAGTATIPATCEGYADIAKIEVRNPNATIYLLVEDNSCWLNASGTLGKKAVTLSTLNEELLEFQNTPEGPTDYRVEGALECPGLSPSILQAEGKGSFTVKDGQKYRLVWVPIGTTPHTRVRVDIVEP